MAKQAGNFEFTISGIPCQILIDSFDSQEGSFNMRAETPEDFYGYTDAEYTVLDRKGYKAAWLDRKIDDETHNEIVDEIKNYVKGSEIC